MRRRTVLACAGSTLLATGAGCFSRSDCPDPAIGEGPSYEEREPRDSALMNAGDEGVLLVTTSDGVDRFGPEQSALDDEDERWVRDTDFDDSVVVGIQVGSSGQSSDLRILGVERESTRAVHVYSCIAERGLTDDWAPYARLLRVPHDGQKPAEARYTHWEEWEKEVYETDA